MSIHWSRACSDWQEKAHERAAVHQNLHHTVLYELEKMQAVYDSRA